MIITLKKNQNINGEQFLKNDEFNLIGINWSENSSQQYYLQKAGKRYVADSSLFDFKLIKQTLPLRPLT